MSENAVVYVIDDDGGARDSLKFLIECAGYDVLAFESARSFLAALPARGTVRPACIVTDVRMPEMTGIELIAKLGELGVTEPVIVITGHADVPMAIQAMKAGVADFIEKPFADDEILSAISRAVSERSAAAALDERRREVVQRIDLLSQREREVMERLVEGKPNKIIAFELGISARTVEVYRAHVMSKMRVRSLSELVRLALDARAI